MPSFASPAPASPPYTPNANPWRFGWPNSADQNFNFHKLLADNDATGIGGVVTDAPRVAVIGAGVAGLTAARELFRSGFPFIDIYEATDRIGGRDYSLALPGNDGFRQTVYEMGAMRFPFFPDTDAPNSAMKYYFDAFGITTEPFPDPGVVRTGIYVNEGFGPDPYIPFPKPDMLIWNPGDGKPPTETLQTIYDRYAAFSAMIQGTFAPVYVKGDADWKTLWHALADHYANLNFRQMAKLPVLAEYDSSRPGYFGGLGFSDDELEIFYVIGAGDGSWGAFFDVGALYIFRTLMCGYGTNHQLIKGRFNGDQFNPGPYYTGKPGSTVPVSNDDTIPAPQYLGIQSLAECMLFLPSEPSGKSLYDAISGRVDDVNINLFVSSPVIELADGGNEGTVYVTSSKQGRGEYELVILTPTTWASQISIKTDGLSSKYLPYTSRNAMNTQHWIRSCKICFALKQNYWSGDNPVIPQVVITDSFLQDIYAYKVGDDDLGVVILSYTWEDDATKLQSYAQSDLIRVCVAEADRITMQTLGVKISDYLDLPTGRAIHWAQQPFYHGCAQLYREGRWGENYELLVYNQKRANSIYFAGEGYSVEGGWTEPAVRLALDAVVNIINDSPTALFKSFDYQNYLILDDAYAPEPLKPFGR